MENTDPESEQPPVETVWRGVYKPEHVADAVQTDWQVGIETGEPCGWSCLNHLYRVKKRQWSVVTGIPSHGKSTWIDNLMINLAQNAGWKFLICSPENQPMERHIESLIEIHSGKKFIHPDNIRDRRHSFQALSGEELGESMVFINDHFRFINPEETDFNIDYILNLALKIKTDPSEDFNFDGFVLDPYNELEHHRTPGMSETEYISQILSKWRRFHRGNDCHGWLVAHPAKQREITNTSGDPKARKTYAMPSLYDIAGSAHWNNKADMGVVVYRNMDQKPQTTTISVQKIRFKECGERGEADLFFDPLCNRMIEHQVDMLYNRGR